MIYDLKDLPCPLSQDFLFDGKRTLEIEIGTGKGKYITDMSKAKPETRFIGIEKSLKWFQMAEKKCEKQGLANVALIHCYLDALLKDYLPFQTVDRFHILFPDPWPKNRHQGRRVFQDRLMKCLWLNLVPGGEILLGTDHREYFESTKELFSNVLHPFYQFDTLPELEFQSNFQVKYIKEGRPLFYAKLVKKGSIETTPDLYVETLKAKQQDHQFSRPFVKDR